MTECEHSLHWCAVTEVIWKESGVENILSRRRLQSKPLWTPAWTLAKPGVSFIKGASTELNLRKGACPVRWGKEMVTQRWLDPGYSQRFHGQWHIGTAGLSADWYR